MKRSPLAPYPIAIFTGAMFVTLVMLVAIVYSAQTGAMPFHVIVDKREP